MLQILLFSDVHTFTDNIRHAIDKTDRVDAILIAGDLEAEENLVKKAAGDIPFYAVCGNCDYYLNTDYPEELLIDIAEHPGRQSGNDSIASNEKAGASSSGIDHSEPAESKTFPDSSAQIRYPAVDTVTALRYQDLPGKTASFPPFLRSIAPNAVLRGLSGVRKPPHVSHRILMTHGKEYDVPYLELLTRRAVLYDADVIIFGHTHKYLSVKDTRGSITRYYLNPGCLAGNPDDDTRTYASYEICSYILLRFGSGGEISVQHMYL